MAAGWHKRIELLSGECIQDQPISFVGHTGQLIRSSGQRRAGQSTEWINSGVNSHVKLLLEAVDYVRYVPGEGIVENVMAA